MNTETLRQLRREGRHDEARQLAVELAAAAPDDAALQYEAACVHDHLGLESEAVPYYRAALAGVLDPASRRSAYLGLGSTYRTLGRYALAEATLREGLAQFPEAQELEVFLAMTLHNRGQGKQAVESLLRVIARTTADEELRSYRQAIEFYAQDIDRAWPSEAG